MAKRKRVISGHNRLKLLVRLVTLRAALGVIEGRLRIPHLVPFPEWSGSVDDWIVQAKAGLSERDKEVAMALSIDRQIWALEKRLALYDEVYW